MRFRVMMLLLIIALPALGQFLPDQPLTTESHESYTTNNNAWAVAASGNFVHVVWFDGRNADASHPWNFEIYYKRSTDRGATWPTGPDFERQLTIDTARSYFPAVAASGNHVHVVWQDYRADSNGVGKSRIWYTRSTNNGLSWNSVDKQLSHPSGSGVSENPCVAVSGSYVHVVWDDNSDGNCKIYYKRSTDNGGTWGSETKLSSGSSSSYLPSVAADGSCVHVAWEDYRDGNWEIYYKRSQNDGTDWGSDTRLTTDNAHSLGPCIAASGGTYVNVLWADSRTGFWNIRRKNSTDGGANWPTEQALTTNASAGVYFELPSLVGSGADFYSVWDDNGLGDYEVRHKRYVNGTMSDLVRLTNSSGFSEYPSIALANNVLHVVWQDNRNDGNYEIYYKRGATTWYPLATSEGSTFGPYSWLAYERRQNKVYAYFDDASRDFYSYSLQSGEWGDHVNPAENAGAGSCGCADGENHAYWVVGGGQGFSEYDGDSKTWNQRQGAPTVTNGASCVYTNGNSVYLLTGGGGGGACGFWKWPVGAQNWTSEAAPPGSGWGAGSWLAYDRTSDTIYAFNSSSLFYKYDVTNNQWNPTALEPMPHVVQDPGPGGCAAVVGGQIFALKGNGTKEFYTYSIADNAWTSLPDAPVNVGLGSSITTDGTFLYAEFANNSRTVYKYTPVMYSFASPPVESVVAAHHVCDKPFAIAPNPLTSGRATVSYSLPRAGTAELSVYNVAGQSVLKRTLAVGSEGSSITLDLHRLRNGVYMVKLTSDGFDGTQKLVVRR